MAQTLSVTIIGDTKSLDRALDRAGAKTSSFGNAMKKAALPAAAALGALAAGAKTAVDSASGLNESMNAVNVVFGTAADKIHAFSKIAATEAGLSMQQFNELVTPVGASLQNVGFSADEAANASINLGKRAADMASVFNVDVSEALEAIQAGLRGEADPLERFGVGLSDAAVTSKALTMGLADTAKELSANDKAQARLKLIMEQSNKVAGDFKNTSGELANQQRINAAEAANQTAKFGQGLLPVMNTLQGVLKTVIGVLGNHTTAVKVGAIAIAALAVSVLAVNAAMTLAPVAAALASLAFIGMGTAATIADKAMRLTIIGALITLGTALVLAYQKSEKFRDVVNAAFNAVKTVATTVFNFIGDHWQAILTVMAGPLGLVIGQVIKHWQSLQSVVATVIGAILKGVDLFLGGLAAVARAASHLPFVGDKFKGIANAIEATREKVHALQRSIDSLRGKDITINVRTINTVDHGRSVDQAPGGAGGRAHGGPVSAGSSYVVGEKGPELFVPGRSGTIIPNGVGSARLAGGGGFTLNVNVNGPIVGDDRERVAAWLGSSIYQEIIRQDKRHGGRIVNYGSPALS